MSKQRIIFQDRGEKVSTTAYVVTGLNRLNQKRQFATDGQRYFYQPTKRDNFILVGELDMPDIVREMLISERRADLIARGVLKPDEQVADKE